MVYSFFAFGHWNNTEVNLHKENVVDSSLTLPEAQRYFKGNFLIAIIMYYFLIFDII